MEQIIQQRITYKTRVYQLLQIIIGYNNTINNIIHQYIFTKNCKICCESSELYPGITKCPGLFFWEAENHCLYTKRRFQYIYNIVKLAKKKNYLIYFDDNFYNQTNWIPGKFEHRKSSFSSDICRYITHSEYPKGYFVDDDSTYDPYETSFVTKWRQQKNICSLEDYNSDDDSDYDYKPTMTDEEKKELCKSIDYYTGKPINIQDFYHNLDITKFQHRFYDSPTHSDMGLYSVETIDYDLPNNVLMFQGQIYTHEKHRTVPYYILISISEDDSAIDDLCIQNYNDLPSLFIRIYPVDLSSGTWWLDHSIDFNMYYMDNVFLSKK